MVSEIITDIQALNISVFAELLKKILIEIFKVILDLAGVEGLRLRGGIDAGSEHIGALVHVGEEKSRADAGLGVEPGATIAVPAGSDLEVERTVDSILLRSEYGS